LRLSTVAGPRERVDGVSVKDPSIRRRPRLARRLRRLDPRSWRVARRRMTDGSGFGFGARLFFSIALTLALVGGAGYLSIVDQLRSQQIESYARAQRADVQAFVSINRRADGKGEALFEVHDLLNAFGQRQGAKEALLIDAQNVVKASGNPPTLHARGSDPRIDAALRLGRSYAGYEAVRKSDHRDFEFVRPITLAGSHYAFEMTYDHHTFDDQLSGIRHVLLIGGVLALIVAGVAFYLLGGRSLMRSHRTALQRATRDGLTDLPNHRAFQDEFPQTLALAERNQGPVALVLLDLDDFKLVNDRHGHPQGDALLRRLAGVLRGGRYGDRAYRIGGDEFALILPHTDGEGARSTAQRLQRELAKVGAAVSMGVSVVRAGQSVDALRSEADAALYEAKRHGGKQVAYFEDISEHVVITTSDKRDAVHRLIDERGVVMAYQPIWNLASGELIGVEALARPDSSYGLSGPHEAFDVAERIGRVHELDVLCVERALALEAAKDRCPLLFVNLSPQTLDLDADDNDWLRSAAERAGWPLGRVVVEVTERFGARTAAVIKSLRRLREQGFKLALDDVGTGNAGLEMLGKVGADFVKIDRSIVATAPAEPNARAVLMAMATLARQTGAFVIAEGIEDEETLDFLRHVDKTDLRPDDMIQGGQGYGLGRPADRIPDAPADLLATTEPVSALSAAP
jgi:diguanylate cyclase (GGDEF)-like protein